MLYSQQESQKRGASNTRSSVKPRFLNRGGLQSQLLQS